MPCKLCWQSLPEAISLVETLEKGQLRGLEGLLIDHRLHAPVKIEELVLRMGSMDHVCRLQQLHVWVYETCVYMVRVALGIADSYVIRLG